MKYLILIILTISLIWPNIHEQSIRFSKVSVQKTHIFCDNTLQRRTHLRLHFAKGIMLTSLYEIESSLKCNCWTMWTKCSINLVVGIPSPCCYMYDQCDLNLHRIRIQTFRKFCCKTKATTCNLNYINGDYRCM